MDNQNKNPLVSIGLSTYNRAHFLTGAVDSWLVQTFKDFELIISDDASTDDTQKICEEYAKKDKRIRYIRQEVNLNIPSCFKAVLGYAKGKYFLWASDDDIYDKRYLAECMDLFNRDPELIMVFTDMVEVNKDLKEIVHRDPATYMPLSRKTYERLKEYILFYFDDGKGHLAYSIWNRKFMLNEPLFGFRAQDDRPPFYWGFDIFFTFRNLAKGPVGFVPKKLFFRRWRALDMHQKFRPFPLRIIITLYHRFGKIFNLPYYWYVMWCIITLPNLTFLEKIKLLFWNFYVMARIFFVRKI